MAKRFLIIFLMLAGCGSAAAQEFEESLTLYFRNGSGEYDRNYRSNGKIADEFFKQIAVLQQLPGVDITGIETIGQTSPEGSDLINRRLAEKRRMSFKNELHRHLDYPDYRIRTESDLDSWDGVAELVRHDPYIIEKDRVLNIISKGGPDMARKLKAIDKGFTYRYIEQVLFPELRTYRMTVTLDFSDYIDKVRLPEDDEIFKGLSPVDDGLEYSQIDQDGSVPFLKVVKHRGKKYVVREEGIPKKYLKEMKRRARKENKGLTYTKPEKTQKPEKTREKAVRPEKPEKPRTRTSMDDPDARFMSIKTNMAGLALGVANIGLEFDVAENVSLNFPFCYSGWEPYGETFKFKGLIAQPEVRFHIPRTGGLYFGVHAGVAWYNMALGGDYRYQNSGWTKPTVGAGLNLGYRIPLGKKTGWGLEVGVGGGAYYAAHDRFYNEPNGPYADRDVRGFYYGIDNVSVSFTYSFNMRRGGRR